MKQKIASLLMKSSTVVSVIAIAVIVLGPVIRLDFPDISLWPLLYAVIALWGFTPASYKLRDLWLAGAFRAVITVWELIDVHVFTENPPPTTKAGLIILLGGTALYVAGLALWSLTQRKEPQDV